MILLIFLLLGLIVYKIKLSSFHKEYVSLDVSNSIKGIFTLLILYSHIRGYCDVKETFGGIYYNFILNKIGQAMVAMFFFYSGYGILYSAARKQNYKETFFRKRFLKILILFDIAVLLYLILQSTLGNSFPIENYILCWTGYLNIGNSNWFVFDILVLYLITHIAFVCNRRYNLSNNAIVILVSICSFLFWLVLLLIDKGNYWFDTVLCFPMGMLFFMYKTRIERISNKTYYTTISIVALFFILTYTVGISPVVLTIKNCLFVSLVILLSLKIRIDNGLLRWLGIHSFSIYILQRLPMILYAHMGWNTNAVMYMIVVACTTFVLSIVYDSLTSKLIKKIL